MLLTSLLAIAPAWHAPQELPVPPLQDAVSRELRLYEIADLIDPRHSFQQEMEKDFLLTTLNLSLADPKAQAKLSVGDRLSLNLLQLALIADRKEVADRETDLMKEYAALERGQDQLADVANPFSPQHYSFDSTEELLDNIRTYMLPAYTGSGASLKVEEHDRRPVLIAYLSSDQADWLQRFLNYQREPSDWAGTVSVQVLQAIDSSRHIPAGMENVSIIADPQAMELDLVTLVENGFHPLSSPTLTLLPSRTGEMSILNQVAYVKDYTLYTVDPGQQQIADPTVDTIQEGLVFSCRLRKVEADKYGLHLSVQYSELQRPIPTSEVHLEGQDDGLHLVVGRPELHSMSAATDVRLQDGAGLRLPSISSDGGKDLVLLINFHRTEMKVDQTQQQRR